MTAAPFQLTATQKLTVGQESEVVYAPALPESATQPGAAAPLAKSGAATIARSISVSTAAGSDRRRRCLGRAFRRDLRVTESPP